ncbi:MAG: sensor histidine kinase, partial [Deferrisomatales bacterium]
MIAPACPADEGPRLAELRGLGLLDTPAEERFDRITRTAAALLSVPWAMVTLVDAGRQWFKSRQGLEPRETPRDVSFCGHAILRDEPLVVRDARRDPRFADNPLVIGQPGIRFYAGRPLRGPGGHKVGTLCVADHRPRRPSAADLAALEDLAGWAENELGATRLEALIAGLADGMVLFGDDGTVEALNPAAERLFGRPAAQVVGRSVEELLPGACRPGGADRGCEGLAGVDPAALGAGRELAAAAAGGAVPVEVSLGEMRWGGRRRYIAVVHNLGPRRAAEERLRLQAAALEAAANGIVITDPGGVIRWVNPAFSRLTGYPAAQALGRHTRVLKSGRQDPAYYRELWRTIAAGEVWAGELVNRRADGSEYVEELTITPVRDAEGRVGHFVAVKQDVTERRLAEERLRELDRLKSEFVSLVSHELKTPLTSIGGYVDLLLDGDAGPLTDEQRDFLEVVHRNARRLTALIEDLLDVSRIEAGRVELRLAPADLGALARGVAESLGPALDAKGQTLALDLPPDLPSAVADADRLTQVLTNLVSNAHKYTPEGGSVRVAARADGAHLTLEVAD